MREAEKQGTPLDENDLWIAATAMALDARHLIINKKG